MRCLVLEDQQVRVDWLRQYRPHWYIEHVTTAQACVDKLAEDWDVIILDHDLDSIEPAENGYRAACNVPENSKVILWSCNPSALARMFGACLERTEHVERAPFTNKDRLGFYLTRLEIGP